MKRHSTLVTHFPMLITIATASNSDSATDLVCLTKCLYYYYHYIIIRTQK